jgi:hypothetical protein
VGGERPLVVGDRLDTDIEGANKVGYDSLLVLTGVTDLSRLVAAPPRLRPTYVTADLGGLAREQEEIELAEDGSACSGGWRAAVRDGRLEVGGAGSPDAWWQAVAAAGWSHLDAAGSAADVSGVRPPT